MPKVIHPTMSVLTFCGRPIPLKRPMTHYAAKRLEKNLPLIAALNQAGKSQADAAAALGTTVCTLRTWIDLTQTTWVNVKRRAPYNIQAK